MSVRKPVLNEDLINVICVTVCHVSICITNWLICLKLCYSVGSNCMFFFHFNKILYTCNISIRKVVLSEVLMKID